MNFIKHFMHSENRYKLLLGAVFLILLAIGNLPSSAQAQSEVEWSDPTNLSQSGAASDPVMVVDADGVFHAFWMDEFEGLVYSSGDGIEWSSPTPMPLPTDEEVPFLITDTLGYIHAFWKDVDGRLFYSRARASVLPNPAAWSSRALIIDSLLDFDVALDELGDLHLSYVNPVDSERVPAGVYYRRLRNGTSTWLAPTLLYASPYFRSLELADSNVDVSTSVVGEEKRVYVAWDNRPRERIYMATSDDDGRTWSEPLEIDQPQSGNVGSGPSNVLVNASGDQVMLLWRKGEPDSFCNQYYQWSQDRGETWSLRQPIYGTTPICLDGVQISHGGDYSIVMGKADQVYFIAWDGNRWSDPQLQEPLTSFVDPETLNPVNLGCIQMVPNNPNVINVIGCDPGTGGDIWTLRRQLLDIAAWFPLESGWGSLEDVDSDDVKLTSPEIITDGQNRVHLLWSKSDSLAEESLGKSIYYTVRQDGGWSPSSEILVSSSGKAEQLDAALDSEDRISIVWSGGRGGEIYFSQAESSQAFIPSSWSDPILLPSPLPVGSSPDILIDGNDVIYVVYAIPLNEQRGIYLTKSEDGGQSWSDARLVFDAQDAKWGLVDEPHLAVTSQGDLYILWTRFSLPSGEGPLELYYARSTDGGFTWSEPELVFEGPVVWSEILGTGTRIIQRVWQQKAGSGSTLWHEQTLDGGDTWQRIAPVSVFGEIVGNPSLTADSAGRLHLILIVRSGIDTYALQHWVYDDQEWRAEPKYDFQFSAITEIQSLDSDISVQGNLSVVVLNSDFTADGSQIYQLIHTGQEVEVPQRNVTPPPPSTSTPAPTLTPIPTPTSITPTPTDLDSFVSPVQLSDEPGNTGLRSWLGILAPVAIGLILVLAITLIIRWVRS